MKAKELEAEAKEAGLGIHQVKHFRSLKFWEAQEAHAAAKKELYALDGFPESPARNQKADKQRAIMNYLDKLMKDRR